MTPHEVNMFYENDKKAYDVAWELAATLNHMGISIYPISVVAYWLYKMEPDRDAILEHISDKSR